MSKRIVFTEKQIQEIIRDYSNGKTIKNISKSYNVSDNTIRRLLKKNNISLFSRIRKSLIRSFCLSSINEGILLQLAR